MGAGVWAENSTSTQKKGLYLGRRIRFVQDAVDAGELTCKKIRGDFNRADILTKALPKDEALFEVFRNYIMNVPNKSK